jgi:hypothetical protein
MLLHIRIYNASFKLILKTALEVERKRKYLKTLDEYHKYRLSRSRLHMNNTHIDTFNPLFKVLQELNTRSNMHAV